MLQNNCFYPKKEPPCKTRFSQRSEQADSLIQDAVCLCKNLGQQYLFLLQISLKGVFTNQKSDAKKNSHVIFILSDFGNYKENYLSNRLFISLSLLAFHCFQDFFFLNIICGGLYKWHFTLQLLWTQTFPAFSSVFCSWNIHIFYFLLLDSGNFEAHHSLFCTYKADHQPFFFFFFLYLFWSPQ